jgi:uncharacterized protein DUF3105
VSKESRRAGRAASRTGAGPASSGPSGSSRAGRRERPRYVERRSFFERYRNLLVGGAVVAVIAVVAGLVLIQATQPAYACTRVFDPSPTPTVSPGSSTRLGFFEEDMGNSHAVTRPQRYLYCPPASGTHIAATGQGPITPRVYKPSDNVGPPNWIHNLEHGGLVVLYRNDSPGATAEGLQAFQQFFDAFPPSPLCQVKPGLVGPVIARFDQMPHPYAVLVWDRVFYMDTWDAALALRFFNTEDERVDKNGVLIQPPEDVFGCGAKLLPAPSGSTAPSVVPSSAPSGSAAPSSVSSGAPSANPAPSPSPSPSPS